MQSPISSFVLGFLLCFMSCSAVAQDPLADYREAAIERWEKDIKQLEELDKSEQDPDNAILFVGSSSIRRWVSMPEDMKPWPTIRRGYGGARFSDLAVFVERIVFPHKFDALAIFVGNDITGKEQDKSPKEVLRLYKYVVEKVRSKNPKQPIFFIAITPTGSRFHAWERVQEMHSMIREYSSGEENMHFIATADAFIGKDGLPMDELFVKDRLHLNDAGYKVWADVIKKQLNTVLGPR